MTGKQKPKVDRSVLDEIEDFGDDSMFSLPLGRQEYAQIQNARMQKYGGKSEEVIPKIDYVFAHDMFYILENFSIDKFSAEIRINPEHEQEFIAKCMEELENGTNTSFRRYVDAAESVRRNRSRRLRDFGGDKRGGDRGGNARLDVRAERSSHRESDTGKSRSDEKGKRGRTNRTESAVDLSKLDQLSAKIKRLEKRLKQKNVSKEQKKEIRRELKQLRAEVAKHLRPNYESDNGKMYSLPSSASIEEMEEQLRWMERQRRTLDDKLSKMQQDDEYIRLFEAIIDASDEERVAAHDNFNKYLDESGMGEISEQSSALTDEIRALHNRLDSAKAKAAKEAREAYRAKYTEEFAKKYASKAARKFGTTSIHFAWR